MNTLTAPAELGLSDAAFTLIGGWFSFGAATELALGATSAAYEANKAALDEIVAKGLATYHFDDWQEKHVYKGTKRAGEIADIAARAMLDMQENGK